MRDEPAGLALAWSAPALLPWVMVTVLESRAALAEVASECRDLARHALEPVVLPRGDARFLLVHTHAGLLGAVFPLRGPMRYAGLPVVALAAGAPVLRAGRARECFGALLDWFRSDGEGAALLVLGPWRREGPTDRAFAHVARERDQMVLAAPGLGAARTLLVGDGPWQELALSALPLARWAKRRVTSIVYAANA